MTTSSPGVRDDTVRPYTRLLAAAIIPFLLVAFPILYVWPHDTGRSFAWEIKPTMTPMVLGSAYLGGAYFFARVIWASRWHTVKSGFVAVALFASLLGIATIVHWDKFNHHHIAFALWAGLYFTTPFLVAAVVLANSTRAVQRSADELLLTPLVRRVIGATGLLAAGVGIFLFLVPKWANTVWPWTLTPLTGRVLGAVFCLGVAGLGVFVDPRWTTARLMLQTEVVMVFLILIAAARAHTELRAANPFTWMLLAGFVAVLAGSACLYLVMNRRLASPSLDAGTPGGAV